MGAAGLRRGLLGEPACLCPRCCEASARRVPRVAGLSPGDRRGSRSQAASCVLCPLHATEQPRLSGEWPRLHWKIPFDPFYFSRRQNWNNMGVLGAAFELSAGRAFQCCCLAPTPSHPVAKSTLSFPTVEVFSACLDNRQAVMLRGSGSHRGGLHRVPPVSQAGTSCSVSGLPVQQEGPGRGELKGCGSSHG